MGLRFFGLTSAYKLELHKTLFSMVYYSNGAFKFEELYSMPVYLRNFYVKQLEQAKTEEVENYKEVQKRSKPSKR